MWSQLDGGIDGGRTVSTTDDAECTSLLWSKGTRAYSTEDDAEDTYLSSSTEDGQLQVAEHWTEIGHRTYTHEDYRWNEASLDQPVVDHVHQTQLMGNLWQTAVVDVVRNLGDRITPDIGLECRGRITCILERCDCNVVDFTTCCNLDNIIEHAAVLKGQ